MLTVLCPASRLDLTLFAMGPGRRAWGYFFCFFFFLVGTRIFVSKHSKGGVILSKEFSVLREFEFSFIVVLFFEDLASRVFLHGTARWRYWSRSSFF